MFQRHVSKTQRRKTEVYGLKSSLCFSCSYFTLLLLLLLLLGGISGNQYSSSLSLVLSLVLSLCLVRSALLKENRHYDISPAKHSKKSQERERDRGGRKDRARESEVKIV